MELPVEVRMRLQWRAEEYVGFPTTLATDIAAALARIDELEDRLDRKEVD